MVRFSMDTFTDSVQFYMARGYGIGSGLRRYFSEHELTLQLKLCMKICGNAFKTKKPHNKKSRQVS